MYRTGPRGLEVFLVHPGGPFFAKKDAGAWSIPKGLVDEGEKFLEAAQREFEEETGLKPEGPFLELGSARLPSGKVVHAWAFRGNWESGRKLRSNSFEMEWPPRSGKKRRFPEVDRAEFFPLEEALRKINAGQRPFLERLSEKIGGRRE